MNKSLLTRREFVGMMGASLVGATFSGCSIVPRHTVARSGRIPPSERLNIAAIGVGGRGAPNVDGLAEGNNIVALCDVDELRAAATFAKYPKARRFTDFRRMLDAIDKEVDAVIVATPDHTHAVAAIAAMERGKHVYCEKPLAHSIGEVRRMMAAAREHKVVTQLGNQGHSAESIRIFCEWIWDGAIGNVHTIHAGCDGTNSAIAELSAIQSRPPVPATLDWDLWLGPAAERPYHPVYLPGRWRAWTPFGTGTVGDWICHVVDPVFWALELGAPAAIRAEVVNYNPKSQGDTFPPGAVITYEFPAQGRRGPVTLHWYSGIKPIPRPAELEPERRDITTGAVVIGDKGTITYGSHGANGVRIIPEARMREYQRPAPSLPRVKGHHQDWLHAVRTGGRAGSDFSYGGPLTEIALLGNIAIKLAGTRLEWDARRMRFPNCPEADQFVDPPYRKGWRA